MSRLKKLSSKEKRKIGLVLSLLIISIGLVPHIILNVSNPSESYIIEPIKLESSNGIYISAWKYTPTGKKNHGGIVISHYLGGSKLHMHPLSSELAKQGFTVLNIDLRGHGASGGSLGVGFEGFEGFIRGDLEKDMEAAVSYFEQNLTYITEIGLIGHSLGGRVALQLARTNPTRINATVIIGTLPSNITKISNILIVFGAMEIGIQEYYLKQHLKQHLKDYTGIMNATIGEFYGDWTNGNNIMVYVGSFSEHLFEVMDGSIIYQTVNWFEQAFGIGTTSNIFITTPISQIFSLFSFLGLIALVFILIVYLSDFLFKHKIICPEREVLKKSPDFTVYKFINYYSIYVVLMGFFIFLLIIELFKDVLLISTVTITISIIFGNAIGTIIIFFLFIMPRVEKISFKRFLLKIKIMSSINSGRSIIFGIVSAILSISAMATFWHWSVHNILPTFSEIGIIIMLVFLTFPLFFIKEFYFRIVQGHLKNTSRTREYLKMVIIGIFMDILILGLVKLSGWVNLIYMPEVVLYLFVLIIFSVIQNIFTTWIYIWSGRNILGSTIFLSVFFAWMSVIFLPSFGFL